MFLPSYYLTKALLFLDTLLLMSLARCLFTMPINLGDFPIIETAIPVATIDAYLATDYQVNTVERFVLNVGRPSPELAQWFQTNKEDQAAFITAWNPSGKPTSDTTNRIAEQKLIGLWPSEPSLLVFGISLESAKALVKRFRQDGFIYVGGDVTPQLILLR